MPLQLPVDLTIVGVGGCGKRLVFEICNNDWFLQHYSENNTNRRLHIYTMDADANEQMDDEIHHNDLLQKIEKLGASGNIKSTFCYLPYLANVNSVADLASAMVAEKVKNKRSDPKVKTWWVNDNTEGGITFDDLNTLDSSLMEDFGGGVHRRRAISKAIFYKVLAEGEAQVFSTFSTTGSIAIIVGLGGGTGSGMFIDLARYIRSFGGNEKPIDLFVVLPTTDEGAKEQLNAAIALTELEYINLDERLFNNIVVTSLGPTGYRRGEEARTEVHEFDSMFPNVFANLFHIERSDIKISDAKGPFSSFIFADSHVIEYPIEELKVFKSQYENIISELGIITGYRNELNQHVFTFLNDYTFEEKAPTMDNFEYMRKEYKNVEYVIKNEVGKLLNYKSMDTIEYFIANEIPDDLQIDKIKSFDDMIRFLNKVKTGSFNVNETDLTDENDKKLARIIPEALKTLEETAGLFKKASGVTDETVRSVLLDILKGNMNIKASIGDLNSASRNLKNEIDGLKNKFQNVEREKGDAEELKYKIERKLDDKLLNVRPDIDHYWTLKKKIRDSVDKEKELKVNIEQFIAKFKSGEMQSRDKINWLKESNVSNIERDIKNIWGENDQNLDSLVDFVNDIAMYYFYESEIKRHKKGNGFLSSLKEFIIGDKNRKIRNSEARKIEKENTIKNNAEKWKIQINNPFEFYIPDDFITNGLNKKATETKELIINAFLNDLNRNQVAIDSLDSIFDLDKIESRSRLREFLIAEYLGKDGYYARIEEINKLMADIKDSIDGRNILAKLMDSAEELHNTTFRSRTEMKKHYDSFYEYLGKINERTKLQNRTKMSLYRTKMGEIDSKVLSLINDRSNLTSLDNDDKGKDQLKKLVYQVKATYPSLLENFKLGIRNPQIQITTTEKWRFSKVGLVIGSTSEYICSSIANDDQIAENINRMMSLDKPRDSHVITHRYAKPWEVTLTFFAAASFIDNISPLASGGGYWRYYEMEKNNILHHVLKMQDGYYITRKKLLDLNDAAKIANSERQKINVLPQIKELYEEKKLKEAFN